MYQLSETFPQNSSPSQECSELSTTLPVSAAMAYTQFTDCERIPEWMSIVRMVRILTRQEDGRASSAAFIANLDHASIGYTLHYKYEDQALAVRWSTVASVNTQISGHCIFLPLGPSACLMQYQTCRSAEGELPVWEDSMYEGHPASAALCEFRDFLNRTK